MRLFGYCRQGIWPAPLAHLADKAELFHGELADTEHVEGILKQARRTG